VQVTRGRAVVVQQDVIAIGREIVQNLNVDAVALGAEGIVVIKVRISHNNVFVVRSVVVAFEKYPGSAKVFEAAVVDQ